MQLRRRLLCRLRSRPFRPVLVSRFISRVSLVRSKKALKRALSAMFWSITPALWDFLAGIVAGLGANVFTARALAPGAPVGVNPWLQFAVFVFASGLAVAAGAVRRRVEGRWQAGGGFPGHEQLFVEAEMRRLLIYALGALVLIFAGLLSIT